VRESVSFAGAAGSRAGEAKGKEVELSWGGVVVPDVWVDGDAWEARAQEELSVGVEFHKLSCVYFPDLPCGETEAADARKEVTVSEHGSPSPHPLVKKSQ
jgi:hypothetical protein